MLYALSRIGRIFDEMVLEKLAEAGEAFSRVVMRESRVEILEFVSEREAVVAKPVRLGRSVRRA